MKIDNEKVREFFDERAALYGKIPTLNVALFQEKQGDLAQRRDQLEYETIMEVLAPYDMHDWLVLDIGCGTGRWAFSLAPLVDWVWAFDISPALIGICKKEQGDLENITFAVGKVDCYPEEFPVCYNLIIVSGVFLYTDDSQWYHIASQMLGRVSSGTKIVIRETIGTHGRFEIDNVWSEELQAYYSAIYRDGDWYRGFFSPYCRTLYDAPMLPLEERKWDNTHQQIFVFEVI